MPPLPASLRPLATRLRGDRLLQIGIVLVGVVAMAALLAPWLAPYDPILGDPQQAYLRAPDASYWLGTDSQGRDVLSRVLYGARIS